MQSTLRLLEEPSVRTAVREASYRVREFFTPLRTLSLLIMLSTALSLCLVFNRRPWCDEAWFADIGYNLLHHGTMGMRILDPHGFPFSTYVKGIDRFSYWVMPGYFLLQAVWYKLLGFSLYTFRGISVFWGAVALWAWYQILARLTRDRVLALIAVALLATDNLFLMSAATGRMDMMCAALGLAGIAVYLIFREERLILAVALSTTICAAAVFTHPNGMFATLALVVIAFVLDRTRLPLWSVILAALPFMVFGGLWGAYIMRAPDVFANQMKAQVNTPHRFELPLNPIEAIRREIQLRYVAPYNLNTDSPAAILSNVFYSYVAALVVLIAVPRFRRQRQVQWLLLAFSAQFMFLACFQKNWYYLVYILPLLWTVYAMAVCNLWRMPGARRWPLLVWTMLLAGLNVGLVGAHTLHSTYRHRFLPAVDYLKAHVTPGSFVLGSGELAFELGFEGQVVDDARLGILSDNPHLPQYIVLEAQYQYYWFPALVVNEPKTWGKMMDLLSSRYKLVYDQSDASYRTYGFSDKAYQVFERRSENDADD
jgi:4-amino-4-deoxy-L-arabinose transferase-like glycosyltransferase